MEAFYTKKTMKRRSCFQRFAYHMYLKTIKEIFSSVYDRTEPLPNLEPNLEPNRSVRFGGDTEVRPNLFSLKNHHLLSGQLRYTTRGVFDNFPRCGLPAGARARAGWVRTRTSALTYAWLRLENPSDNYVLGKGSVRLKVRPNRTFP